jgi:hypothetical protein
MKSCTRSIVGPFSEKGPICIVCAAWPSEKDSNRIFDNADLNGKSGRSANRASGVLKASIIVSPPYPIIINIVWLTQDMGVEKYAMSACILPKFNPLNSYEKLHVCFEYPESLEGEIITIQ